MLEDFNVWNFLIFFFGLFALIAIVAIAGAVFLARAKNKNNASTSFNSDEKVIVEKETIKEIVMVPCEYCGSLNLQTALFCNNCGAGRKAQKIAAK